MVRPLDDLGHLMRPNDGSGMTNSPGVLDLSDDPDMSSHHLVEGLDDARVVSEAVSLHNME